MNHTKPRIDTTRGSWLISNERAASVQCSAEKWRFVSSDDVTKGLRIGSYVSKTDGQRSYTICTFGAYVSRVWLCPFTGFLKPRTRRAIKDRNNRTQTSLLSEWYILYAWMNGVGKMKTLEAPPNI